MVKIVLTHRLHEDGMKILESEASVAIVNTGNPREMLPELVDADGLIIRIGSIDRATLQAAPRLKAIGRPGVGVDDVDVATATELGIPVIIAPGANTLSVAEHALALMLTAAKDIPASDHAMRTGNFAIRSQYKATEIAGKTLGLIGGGHIGGELARLCSALGMKIVVFDLFVDPSVMAAKGYRCAATMDEILQAADIVSLHVPLTPQTRNLIGAREIGLMHPDAILVNCARGGIVDEQALTEALCKNRIRAAALDVFSEEPLPVENPLCSLDNAIITPHMAGLTREAASAVATRAVEGVLAVIAGKRWPNVANPDVYEHPSWKK